MGELRIVTGHVHMQFERVVGGVRWIGAGSVGMPYELEPAAYWALVTPDAVEFRRTGYDRSVAAATVRASGYPGAKEFAEENLLTCPTPEAALDAFSP